MTFKINIFKMFKNIKRGHKRNKTMWKKPREL